MERVDERTFVAVVSVVVDDGECVYKRVWCGGFAIDVVGWMGPRIF